MLTTNMLIFVLQSAERDLVQRQHSVHQEIRRQTQHANIKVDNADERR